MKNEQQPTKQSSSSHSTVNMDSHLNQDSRKKNQSSNISEAKSPIKEADKIVNQSRETRDKEYGGFTASMKRTAAIASELCNKEITTDDAFKMLMALKLSRLSYSPDHFDSYTDLMGYAEGWWKYREEQKPKAIVNEEGKELFDLGPFAHWPTRKQIEEYKEAIRTTFGKLQNKNAPIQAIEGEKIFLENLVKTLTSHGYRVFPPEGGHSFTESMDWKDQQQ